MQNYHDLIEDIMNNGSIRDDRTNTGTLSLFGKSIKFNLKDGFPILTTKKTHWKSVVYELLWMISGDSNIRKLQENKITIWDEWANENGDLGPVYGVQWRHWGNDQLANVIKEIKNNPSSRRLIVNSWNADEIKNMALPPCHMMFQFYVNNGSLDCQMYQRSCDVFLGLPFNIASYALLTHMVAQITNLDVGILNIVFGDVHLYLNHVEQAKILLTREHLPLPKLALNKNITNIDKFKFEDIALEGYQHHPAIPAPVAV